jgi:hypothetical protein
VRSLRDRRRSDQFEEALMIITESFDRRTLAAMEVALDRACESLGVAREQHDARRYIASKILECALRGERTRDALTEAGRVAAMRVLARNGVVGLSDRASQIDPDGDQRQSS